MAAVEVLERAGCRVLVPQPDLCCGRPLYEQGMLGAARVRLAQAVCGLGPYLQRGIPVIGLEPSCIFTFRDELPATFPSLESARALAERAMTLDEFLVGEMAGFEPPGLSRPALVQGHCHRKAIGSMESELELLGRMKGLSVSAPDTGCCGMAGAFGYEGRHYEVSRAVGERVLLPAVRQSSPKTLVIADGFSCRAQIRQFCPGREPLHVAQVLELAYRSAGQAT